MRATSLSAEDLEDFFRLLPRIYADYRDPRRGPFKLAYIYANTQDNEDSMFLRAIELANAGAIKSLGISEGDVGPYYEGYDHSVERLKVLGWRGQVPLVKLDVGGNVNTLSEARALANFGLVHKGDIGIIAPHFHLVRAFITTITALQHNRREMHRTGDMTRVYAVPGVSVPWMQRVVHSQGVLVNTRAGLLDDELQRLEKYRAPEFGGILSASKVIEYLNWRGS